LEENKFLNGIASSFEESAVSIKLKDIYYAGIIGPGNKYK
jgi:hypothetical protein